MLTEISTAFCPCPATTANITQNIVGSLLAGATINLAYEAATRLHAPNKAEPKAMRFAPDTQTSEKISPFSLTLRTLALPIAKHTVLSPWMPSPIQRATLDFFSSISQPPAPDLHIQSNAPLTKPTSDSIKPVTGTIISANHEGKAAPGAIMHIHGGAYRTCSATTHQAMCQEITQKTKMDSVIPDYGLAPEHVFPEALDQCLDVYKNLLQQHPANKIVLSGDSAGGGLLIMLVNKAIKEGLPPPAGCVMLSPWVDLEPGKGKDIDDPLISRAFLNHAAKQYAPRDKRDKANPAKQSIKQFPPLFILTGGKELLRRDAELLHKKAQASNVKSKLEVWDEMFHAFPILPMLPETSPAIDQISAFALKAANIKPVTTPTKAT